MDNLEGCQLPGLPGIADGYAVIGPQPLFLRLKRALAVPWNYRIKPSLKHMLSMFLNLRSRLRSVPAQKSISTSSVIEPGDLVRVRSRQEVQATLNRWKELKGCAFLEDMWKYCETTQRVHKRMERFLDERDYKVKKCKGIILLKGVYCTGTPVFGRCDRSCLLFWREEWLEKVE